MPEGQSRAASTGSGEALILRRRAALGGIAAACLTAGCTGVSDFLPSHRLSVPETSRVGDPFPIGVEDVEEGTVVVTATDARGRRLRREYDVGREREVARPRMLLARLELAEDESGPPTFVAPEEGAVEVRVVARRDDVALHATTVRREYVDPAVEGEAIHRGGRQFGTFYRPGGGRRGPGVLTLHGPGGPPTRRTASVLASRGYPSLALNAVGLNGHPWARTPVEYLTDAAEWLVERPEVTGDRVGVVGVSQGADGALLTGIHSSAVGAVVAYDAAPTATGVYRPGGEMPGPPHTLDGEAYLDHEAVRAFWEAMLAEIEDRGGVADCDFECYTSAYAALDPATQAKNTFRVEEIDGPVRFLDSAHSPDARFWVGPESLAAQFEADRWKQRRLTAPAVVRLRQHGHDHRYDRVTFEDSVRGIGVAPPYTAEPAPGVLEQNAQAHHDTPVASTYRARARAWPRLLDCLAAGIGRPPRDATTTTATT